MDKGDTIVAVVEGRTAEQAEHLIRFYQSRGYRFVEFTRWPEVNYRSMIFAKTLR